MTSIKMVPLREGKLTVCPTPDEMAFERKLGI
jgi:hypothetical protein